MFLTADAFERIMNENPRFKAIISTLVEKNKQLAEARRLRARDDMNVGEEDLAPNEVRFSEVHR